MKSLLSALFLIAFSGTAAAASAATASPSNVEDYNYSTPLNIAKVVNITRGDYCGIGPREMTYVDTKGATHVLRYQAFGDSCIDQN
ncbi:DUF2790 domain-containing protein [Pseudomonas sp. URMO17WK12:I11]|uniref:DUF2790 domain-containing protein n=1 Tax=Pseudomonas sp. URMO17WK12:I11 TaxID=1283291 RepID=UPI0007221DEE|nr:DUF2790 domain-containing protein [Pseudomonas sp. URMO17WK12:I11]CRL52342.1 hypothetical protein PSHI_55500 [Pseudomonas sp. URMO17WK12:I11]